MSEYHRLTTRERIAGQEVLRRHGMTESGVIFRLYKENDLHIYPPGHPPLGEVFITDRSIDEIDNELPGVKGAINKVKGRLAFLGNGLSDAPLHAAKRYLEGDLKYPPIVVDCFDYSRLSQDLLAIAADFHYKKLDIRSSMGRSLDSVVLTATALADAITAGNLVGVNYYFGRGIPPETLAELNVAVNCYGPRQNSLKEQLSLLAEGGEFYTNRGVYEVLPSGFKRQVLPNRVAVKISKARRPLYKRVPPFS